MATSAIAKLSAKQEPKIVRGLPDRLRHWGPPQASMVIATPAEVNELMAKIPKGKLATMTTLRDALAKRHGTTIACPLTTSIFAGIAAKAASEMEAMGAKRVTPWWRLLKSDGKLNEKMPGGLAEHRKRLVAEGHKVVRKGKTSLVIEDFEKRLATLG
jgi:alkylated DNA nucleotide flippase Atl1